MSIASNSNGAPNGGSLITIPEEANTPLNGLSLKTDSTATGNPAFKHKIWNKALEYLDIINTGTSILSNAIGNKTYDTKYGYITAGMDTAYDVILKSASKFGPVGQAVGVAMGANKLLNNIANNYLGAGTDGMTKLDAIFGSAFLGPFGWINGWGGKKAKQYFRNAELDAKTSGGYLGFLTTENITQIGAGKKYGLLSSGARHKLNRLTEFTENMKHSISGVVNSNEINLLAAQGNTPFLVQQQSIDLNGGIQQMRAARKGMKVEKYQNSANPFLSNKNPFKQPAYKTPKGIKNLTPKRWGPEGMMLLYDKNGNPTRGLTRALELGYEPVVKYNGKAGFIGYDSNPALPYMLKAIGNYKNGALFCRRIVSKYSIGSKLRRSIQTVDIVTGKYVDLPTDLTKEQVNGQMPIKLSNGTVVFMLKNGTVTSDRWETVGEREHLTPKGLEGMIILLQDTPTLELFIALKILEKKLAAILKAVTRKTPFMFKNPDWKNCIATAIDNFGLIDKNGIPIVIRNTDFAADPNKYGFREYPLGDTTDNLPDGVLILDYNNPRDRSVPGHTIMLVGRDENWVPIYSYSSGDNNAKSMHNLTKNYSFYWTDKVKPKVYEYIGTPNERESWEKEYYNVYPTQIPILKQGGQMNVIPEGALHARLNHMKDVDENLAKLITNKGIPVITVEKDGEIVQHAEIEHSEIIYNLEVTNKIEDLRKKYKETKDDKYAIEAGKILCYETLHNIDDRMNLIPNIT